MSPGIPADVLFNIENWQEAVHHHRGKLLLKLRKIDKKYLVILADCSKTIDQNGLCKVTKHFAACESPRTSKNSTSRPLQRKMRENVVHLAEQNPARRTRYLVQDGMLQIPEFRSPTGGIIAAAAETHGITRRRERQSIKNVKNLLRGGEAGAIPEHFRNIMGNFPSIVNGRRQIQADEKQFVHERGDKLYFFVASDLDFLEQNAMFADGTFKLSNQIHGFAQLYNFAVKFQSDDGTRSFCYTVMSVLVKDQTEKTYREMLGDLKDFFQLRHARELKIKRIHSDREIGFVKAAQEAFPDAQLLMCLVHIDRTLQLQGTEHLGSIWRNDEGLKKYQRMLKKVFYLPFNENQGVREKFYEFLNSVEDLVDGPHQKRLAKEFATYFHQWLLENRHIGIRNIDYRRAFLEDDFDGDCTNNVSECLNHQLNTRIGPGRLTMARAIETLHELKTEQIGILVANLTDDVNMEKRSGIFLAKRVLIRRKVSNFDKLTPEQQANRTIR